MQFIESRLRGAFLVQAEPIQDDRGYFARTYCEREMAQRGLCSRFVQRNLSHNRRRGTLRGMHFQRVPFAEAKLVTCVRGSLHDVIVDLRSGSPTLHHWQAFVLRADTPASLYVPEGFAHGFQTLEDDTVVDYLMSSFYEPGSSGGIRWDDPRLSIEWPDADERVLSDRDSSYDLLPA